MSEQKFTSNDLREACDDLETIPRFPTASRASVIVQMGRMCPHLPALKWTVATAVAHWKTWMGLAEFRALLCTRFDAADGVDDHNCTTPGYTPDECEQRFIEHHERLKSLDSQFTDSSRRLIKQLADAKGIGGGQ